MEDIKRHKRVACISQQNRVVDMMNITILDRVYATRGWIA